MHCLGSSASGCDLCLNVIHDFLGLHRLHILLMTDNRSTEVRLNHYIVFAGVMSTNISSYFHGQVHFSTNEDRNSVHRDETVKSHGEGHKWVSL